MHSIIFDTRLTWIFDNFLPILRGEIRFGFLGSLGLGEDVLRPVILKYISGTKVVVTSNWSVYY